MAIYNETNVKKVTYMKYFNKYFEFILKSIELIIYEVSLKDESYIEC